MWLLIITVSSGVFGAVLQHYIPRVMTSDVPLETIYDEIGNVRSLLREEADRAFESLCGSLGLGKSSSGEVQRAGGFTALRTIAASAVLLRTSAAVSAGASAAVAAAPELVLLSEEESAPLRAFYLDEMRPYRSGRNKAASASAMLTKRVGCFPDCARCCPPQLTSRLRTSKTFAMRRGSLPARSAYTTGCTAGCCCNVPLSLALILLGAIHAVTALRY